MKSLLILFFLPVLFSSCHKKENQKLAKNFSTLMGANKSIWKFVVTDRDFDNIQYFRSLYNKNKELIFSEKEPNKIPKVIHFIWLGPKPFPKQSIEKVCSWVYHHPDWKVNYWTDRKRILPHPSMEVRLVSEFEFLHLGSCFKDADDYREQSCLLCYEILYQEGGICCHHDVSCFRSFIPFHRFDFYCGMALPHHPILSNAISICNAIVGARPGHPILRKCMKKITSHWEQLGNDYSSKDRDAIAHLAANRTVLPLEESVKLTANQEENCDIVLPAGYFNKIEGDFGLYAHHDYEWNWLYHGSQFECYTCDRLTTIECKSNRIILIGAIILLINVILFSIGWIQYRKLYHIFKNGR